MRQCFAGLDALVPRVSKLDIAIASAISEPRTTATAATNSPRFRDDATFGACGSDFSHHDYWCVYVRIGQHTEMKTRKPSLFALRARGSIYMALVLDLRLQASTPSNHL